MLVEVLFNRLSRNAVEVAIFETLRGVTRMITAGTAPPYHALAYNLEKMAKDNPRDWKFTDGGQTRFTMEEYVYPLPR